MLKIDLCHLANILTNINDMMKVAFCYLANTLTNIDNETEYFTREKFVMSNQLPTPYHWMMLKDNNFIPQ